MKKVLVMAALVGAAGAAHAEDSALAGFYAGGHVARVQATMSIEDSDCWYECSSYTQDANGFDFGVQGGYNWVQDNFLMGVSLEYTAGGADETYDYAGYGSPDNMHAISELKNLASLRFRAGLTMGKTAVVISTGPAQGDFDSKFLDRDDGNPSATQYAAEQTGNVSGWVNGINIEHAFADNIVAGVGYSNYVFDDDYDIMRDQTTGAISGDYQVKFINSASSTNFFVNYQF